MKKLQSSRARPRESGGIGAAPPSLELMVGIAKEVSVFNEPRTPRVRGEHKQKFFVEEK
jgi:hypothetical protein